MKRTKYLIAALAIPFITAGFAPDNGDGRVSDAENRQQETQALTPQGQDIVIGTQVGNRAPELKFTSPDGSTIALSELRGKVVLVDFWASWCGPCRRENPNVVAAYEKYSKAKFKDAKGFEIYGVSLDQSQDRWVAAIEQDKLSWPAHVSDLKGWQSEAAMMYGVRSIPSNFLIGPDGIVIARNLRGPDLHIALDKLVTKFK